jgi:hypothetical protein
MNSRNKGKTGELELAQVLRGYGYDCRRGQQFCGANGDADVVGLPGIHIECKRVEKLNIDEALDQSVRDAREGEIPAVFHRKNRKKWKVTLGLEDFMDLYQATIQLIGMMQQGQDHTGVGGSNGARSAEQEGPGILPEDG